MNLFKCDHKKAQKLYLKNKEFCDERGITLDEIVWDKNKGDWKYPSEYKTVYNDTKTYAQRNKKEKQFRTKESGLITFIHPEDEAFYKRKEILPPKTE